jgi:hypothetical protein
MRGALGIGTARVKSLGHGAGHAREGAQCALQSRLPRNERRRDLVRFGTRPLDASVSDGTWRSTDARSVIDREMLCAQRTEWQAARDAIEAFAKAEGGGGDSRRVRGSASR